MASPAIDGTPATVGLRAATCAELNPLPGQQTAMILFWIDGDLSGLTDDTTLNPAGLEAFATSMAHYCQTHPTAELLDSARSIGLE